MVRGRPGTGGALSRPRVVVARGELPEDDAFLRILSDHVDLAVYAGGTRRPPADAPYAVRLFPTVQVTGPSQVGWWLRGLMRALASDAPDLIHVAGEPWSFIAVRAARYARSHPSSRLVLHGMETIWWHGGVPERLAKWMFSRYALGRADAWAAEGSLGVARALARGFPSRERTAVIHTNPRDPHVFQPAHGDERMRRRHELGLPTTGTGYGFAARLVEEKGPLLFLDAWEAVRDELPGPAWAAVAGTGPLEKRVADRASELGVTFLGGLSFPDEVARFWGCLDVAVVPSWTTGEVEEQGPRVIIEAMLSGCAIVGADSGAIPEMMGDVGVVFRQRDPVDLSRALQDIARMAGRTDLRVTSRQHACHHYSAAVTAERLLALWDKACRRDRRY